MPKSVRRRSKKSKRASKKKRARFPLHKRPSTKGVHTFTGEISGGQLVVPSGTTTLYQSAVWIIRLPNIPIYATMGPNFEFVRLNKWSITYLPKSNMQTNLPFLPSSGVNQQGTSISGTLITAVDQVPLVGANATTTPATCWTTDATETNVTLATPYSFTSLAANQPGVDYVRGIERCKETELTSKVTTSFYPTFYSEVVDAFGTQSTGNSNYTAGSSGYCFERRIKKWINCTVIAIPGSGAQVSPQLNTGPYYYGPIFALCVNQPAYMSSTETFPLFDIRMKYSISFKRIRGQ